MKKPFWVLENIDTGAHKRLFNVWGVEWLATRHSWLSILSYGIIGLVITGFRGELSTDPVSWSRGLFYGLLFYSTNIVHTLGHILAGHLVGYPMQGNLLTATFDVNLYTGDQSTFPRQVHLGRALGGPLLNLATGLICLILWQWLGGTWLVVLGYMHLASALLTLLPIAPMDGWVISQHVHPRHPLENQD